MEELRDRAEELAVAVDSSWEGVSEPVEGDAVEDFVEGWGRVGPLLEFLADPWDGRSVDGIFDRKV